MIQYGGIFSVIQAHLVFTSCLYVCNVVPHSVCITYCSDLDLVATTVSELVGPTQYSQNVSQGFA